ncbi:MAG: M48 family metalloprotease [Candidatus Margulisbacteria bacterium]|jgi:predicted Zn-dependent protease|nr:M48 family metalloprotease [Candidatus Margulisiibacteriota bacterium]
MKIKRWLSGAFCLLFLAACSRNPVNESYNLNFYSDADEIRIGEEYHPQIIKEYGGEYNAPALRAYVQNIVNRLGDVSHRPQLVYPVTLLDSNEINAFAIPGGHVYVCRGLLAYINSEAELAGVMGHEIGHVNAKHGLQRMSKSTGFNLGAVILSLLLFQDDEDKQNTAYRVGQTVFNVALLSYSREDEMEADRLGIEYENKAGFSPLGVGRVMTMFERLSGVSSQLSTVLSTHPASSDRSKQARIEVRKLEEKGSINRELNRERYLEQINGLVTSAKGQPVKQLQIYTVQKGDAWDNLAARYFNGDAAKKLAWFNGCELSEPLPARIKLGLF